MAPRKQPLRRAEKGVSREDILSAAANCQKTNSAPAVTPCSSKAAATECPSKKTKVTKAAAKTGRKLKPITVTATGPARATRSRTKGVQNVKLDDKGNVIVAICPGQRKAERKKKGKAV